MTVEETEAVDEALVADIAARASGVRDRVARAAQRAGREPSEVRLIAVTKTHPVATVRAALAAGLTDLGENRVDELRDKSEAVAARWHLVGQLQRNKVRDVVGRVALVHSVDRPALVDALSRRAAQLGVVQDILLQVNVGEDPAKGGCRLADVPVLVSYAAAAPGLRVVGLMTVPPLPGPGTTSDEAARPHFRSLREARDRFRAEHPALEELSMGMSDDLEAAVEEGATMVRIGSALFGSRTEAAR